MHACGLWNSSANELCSVSVHSEYRQRHRLMWLCTEIELDFFMYQLKVWSMSLCVFVCIVWGQ